MSHFAVMVITNEEPTQEILATALQPFHEYECTGVKDQYVRFVDCTEEVEQEWNTETKERWRNDNTGEVMDPYDDVFYRDFTPDEISALGMSGKTPCGTGCCGGLCYHSKDWGDGLGYRSKVHLDGPPLGFSKIEVPLSQVYSSIIEYAKEWHGYDIDASGKRIGNWTNPDRKWDWWCVGGRYSNRLRIKGQNSGCDSAQVRELDFDGMGKARRRALRGYLNEAVNKIIIKHADKGLTEELVLKLWSDGVESLQASRKVWEERGKQGTFSDFLETWEAATDFRYAQEMGIFSEISFMGGFPDDQPDLLKYISEHPALTCFAFLTPEGKWFEQGEMGWWCCVSNEDKVSFDVNFNKALSELKPDQFVTIVDCHI